MSEETFRWVVTGGVAIATLCILVMAVIMFVLYRLVAKFLPKVSELITRAEPILDTTKKVAADLQPKIAVISANAAEISRTAREISVQAKEIAIQGKDIAIMAKDQAHRFAEVGKDIADRTRVQVARVDAAVDETVGQVHNAGDNVKTVVMKPVREASAVIAGVKAAVSSLVDGRRPTVDHVVQDEEMFI